MAHTSKQGKYARCRALTSGEQHRQVRKANKLVDALDEIQQTFIGHMAKLVDALDLGSSGVTHQSSSLCMPTKNRFVIKNT